MGLQDTPVFLFTDMYTGRQGTAGMTAGDYIAGA